MNRLLLAVVIVILSPGLALAQGGIVGLYADTDGAVCDIPDVSGTLSFHVVLTMTPGATAVGFSAPRPACMVDASWLSDSHVFPVTIFNSQDGIGIGFGACLTGPIHVLTINYTSCGKIEPCCVYPILPDMNQLSGEVETTDCSSTFEIVYAVGASAVINPDATCPCSSVAAEETSWGRIKSMYSD